MGAGQSGATEIDGSSKGYQVLRVYPNSPGYRAGLKAYFDFIVTIGNTRFNKEDGSLREILKASVDKNLRMIVYNSKTKSTREVEIVPSLSWGGNGLLGVSIKHSSFDRADERVWHVIDVEPGSPAQQAGLMANVDYVIGSDSILQENDDLYSVVETHEGKSLKLFVYNIANDNCREVVCYPNSKWGGKGYLGCEFGHGLLHRIPFGDVQPEHNDNPKASLLRNEQPTAIQQTQPSGIDPLSFQGQLTHDRTLPLPTHQQAYQQSYQQNYQQAYQQNYQHSYPQQPYQQQSYEQTKQDHNSHPYQQSHPQAHIQDSLPTPMQAQQQPQAQSQPPLLPQPPSMPQPPTLQQPPPMPQPPTLQQPPTQPLTSMHPQPPAQSQLPTQPEPMNQSQPLAHTLNKPPNYPQPYRQGFQDLPPAYQHVLPPNPMQDSPQTHPQNQPQASLQAHVQASPLFHGA